MDKKYAAENLLNELSSYHGAVIRQMKQMAELYIKLAELETKKESSCNKYRQLVKSGNDDLRQDSVMEQFFGLVNTFLQNHRDTWKRSLRIRTYKVVPFTSSAGVLEWVNGSVPLGEYLIGRMRSGGAHGRYGAGDCTFLKCR
ncbi:hypothetical protein POM88_016430 [Heracleum sosnowskyi]|uniref:PI3K/PI4K catalytic domain-containing protein n=1 Tax=Heracleum sosnowskyi TaxID=360622 RepID=A0AAD8ILZ5_9APIA|nr:hypothetical protein POM88_016430 [Heracleum sosnowskyi]